MSTLCARIGASGYVIGIKEDVTHNSRVLISASIVIGNSEDPVFDADWNIIEVAAKGIKGQNQLKEKNFYEVISIKSLINIRQSPELVK